MTINDGIHFNRMARSRELDRALHAIIQEHGIDIERLKREWWQIPGRSKWARDTYYTLLDTLQKEMDCQLATARGHLSKLLRTRHHG